MKLTILLCLLYIPSLFWAQSKIADLIKKDYTWDSKIVLNPKTKKSLVPIDINEALLYLDNVNSIDGKTVTYLDFDSLCTIAENRNLIEKKLIDIYDNVWSYRDLKAKWDEIKKQHSFEFSESNINTIIDKNYKNSNLQYWQLYNRIFDSLATPYKLSMEKKLLNTSVPQFAILLASWLKLPMCLKYLQKVYEEKDKRFDINSIKLALAKSNIDTFESYYINTARNYFLENIKTNESDLGLFAQNLFFIGSQESIFAINYLIDTTQKFEPYSNSTYKEFLSSVIFPRIYYLIENEDFRLIFKNIPIPIPIRSYHSTGEDLLKMKNWLVLNKGKYKLNKVYFF